MPLKVNDMIGGHDIKPGSCSNRGENADSKAIATAELRDQTETSLARITARSGLRVTIDDGYAQPVNQGEMVRKGLLEFFLNAKDHANLPDR